jgi:arsenite methyltransferase
VLGVIRNFIKGRDLRNETEVLREGVCRAYSAAADDPAAGHRFPVGRDFAESLGYDGELLDILPAEAADSFAGVSNVSVFADIPAGASVLDVGCGGGLDSLVAARKAGPAGSVQGVDFSEAMIAKAKQSASAAGLTIGFHLSAAEDLPVEGGSIDVVLANGIFNLNPRRREIFREMRRVLKPGGTVYAAELVFKQPQKKKPVRNLDDWFN